jgi:hypothetical protein
LAKSRTSAAPGRPAAGARPGIERRPRWSRASSPALGRPRRGPLGRSPSRVADPNRHAPPDRPELHRREVLGLVAHHMAEGRRPADHVRRPRRPGTRRSTDQAAALRLRGRLAHAAAPAPGR